MLKRRTGDGDGITLEMGEDGGPKHAGWVLLQEDNLTAPSVERFPLINEALQGAFAGGTTPGPGKLCSRSNSSVWVRELRCHFENGHQHALSDNSEWISAGTPMTTALLLSMALQLNPINPLGTAHRPPPIGDGLQAQSTGPLGHVLLIDP